MSDMYDKVNKLYAEGTFMSKYSGDVWIAVILSIIFFIVLFNYISAIYSQPIVADWINRRCDPAIIPFAGFINAPEGTSAFDYTGENFDICVQQALKDPAQAALKPLYKKISTVSKQYEKLTDNVTVNRDIISNLRTETANSFKNIYDRLLNITIPIVHVIAKSKDILNKTNATLLNSVYTIRGGFVVTDSIFLYIYEQIVRILWVMHAFIISCFTIGWMFPPTLAAGVSAASFLATLLIPLVSFIAIIEMLGPSALKSGLKKPPGIPTRRMCFAGTTTINTKHKRDVMIKDIVLGQELHDGSIVTALMKSTARGSTLYRIGDVVVTGTHKIYDDVLGWIDVEQYNNKILVENFNEQYVYCIGTDTKIIKIGEIVFSDWDEVDDAMISKLCGDNLKTTDIHTNFDVGLHPETIIQLQCGKHIKIKDVDVGDILTCGAIVETIVKVKTDDIKEFCDIKYKGKLILSATENTEIIVETYRDIEMTTTTPPDVCYHIVTTTGGFKTAGVFIGDYNRGIDKFFVQL